jgi:hypothetical protein
VDYLYKQRTFDIYMVVSVVSVGPRRPGKLPALAKIQIQNCLRTVKVSLPVVCNVWHVV